MDGSVDQKWAQGRFARHRAFLKPGPTHSRTPSPRPSCVTGMLAIALGDVGQGAAALKPLPTPRPASMPLT